MGYNIFYAILDKDDNTYMVKIGDNDVPFF
jgi:hypothetical protein